MIRPGAQVVFAVFLVASGARAEERHAVIIGNNQGEAGELPLRYAEADAERMATVLGDIGGVAPENLVLLQGADSEAVRRALLVVNERIRAGRPQNTTLIVYYSGHADEEALHLGDSKLSLDELRRLILGSAAAFRVSIVDACRSGGLTQVKGGSIVPRTNVLVRDDVVGEGTVFLTATSASEDAQESEEIRGSFFTHYLVTGLLGAADDDGDGSVDLNEAYRFAYDNTLRASSRTLAGVQHPTFRQDLKGKGDVVLTRWAAGSDRAFFTFPPGQAWLLMRESEGGAIVAEIGAQNSNRTIGVRPGTYYVFGRGRNAISEGSVDAPPEARIEVGELRLTRTDYAQLVRKGGQQAPKVSHGVQAGYRLRSGLESDSGPCQGFFAGYSADLRAVTLIGRTGFCTGGFVFRGVSGTAREFDLEGRVHRPFDLRSLTFDFGIGVAVTFLHQELPAAPDDGVAAQDRRTTGAHGDVSVGLQYAFNKGFYIGLEGSAMVYLFDVQQTESSSALEAKFAGRLQAGVGKRF